MRAMGLDVGSVTVGIALSDPLKMIASSYKVIRYEEENDALFQEIVKIAIENEVDTIVVGMPYLLNKDESESCQRSKRFIQKLQSFVAMPILAIDERFTTTSAQKALLTFDVKRKKRREVVDKVAAALILQNYLDTKCH